MRFPISESFELAVVVFNLVVIKIRAVVVHTGLIKSLLDPSQRKHQYAGVSTLAYLSLDY